MSGAKIRLGTKLTYGIGGSAEGIQTTATTFFLLFYYTQVLGLSGALTGLALMIALFSDAITDPLVGTLSDHLRHRWGRRHPFMYASGLPLAASFVLLFSPPDGLAQIGLFTWLTTFAVLTRAAVTLFIVPHYALGAELTEDYRERNSVVAYRGFLNFIGASVIIVGAFAAFFTPTPEYDNGQLNPNAYFGFGLMCAALMVVAIYLAALGTHRLIPTLPQPHATQRFGVREFGQDLLQALANQSFRALFLSLALFVIGRSTADALMLHMGTYFWKLSSTDVQYLPLCALGGVPIGIPVWVLIGRYIDKRPMFILAVALFTVMSTAPPVAKISGLYPAAESPLYLGILVVTGLLSGIAGAGIVVAVGSMVADIADEHELSTDRRQEGIFFGALAFTLKAAGGLGSWMAGTTLALIDFPQTAEPAAVATGKINALGTIYGPGAALLAIISLWVITRYRIDAVRHAEIRTALEHR